MILYLVNAAENPEDAGYVQPELEILAWIGEPMLLLNVCKWVDAAGAKWTSG